jgi:hypothetical protein
MNKKVQLFLIGVGVVAAGLLTFFLIRGTIVQIKDRRERIQFGLRRSTPNEIQ